MFIQHIATRNLGPVNAYSVDFESSSSQYASITDAAQTGLDFTTAFTFEGYVKFESLTSNIGFLGKATNSTTDIAYTFVWNQATDELRCRLSDTGSSSNSYSSTTTAGFSTGVWYHIAVTFDGAANELKFYVDGTQLGTTVTTSESSLFNSSENFLLGLNQVGGANMDGLMNNWRVWNVVRTQPQISTNTDDIITTGTGLVSSWFSVNNNFEDLTATGNDLTNVNSAVFSTDVPF